MKHFLLMISAFIVALFIASVAQAVSLPNGTAVFETSLASRISSTDTSMTLVTNSAGGETVNGYDCFVIDEGRSDAEYVCGTVSGTSVTGLERGLSYANGTTTSSLRAKAHRVGANVKKTDFPLIQRLRNVANGTEGLPNPIGYASHPDFSGALGTTIPDITYVAGLVGGGAGVPLPVNVGGTGAITFSSMLLQGNGTNPVTGTSTPTVAAITATSTATSTFAGPIANSSTATSTFAGNLEIQGNASTTGKTVFNGPLTANATTTLAGSNVNSNAICINGVCYAFPSTQGAAGSTFINNGSGTLTSGNPIASQYTFASTSQANIGQNGSITSTALGIPAGTLTASSTVRVSGLFKCATSGSGGNCTMSFIDSGANTYSSLTISPGTSVTCYLPYTIIARSNNSLSAQTTLMTGLQVCGSGSTDVYTDISGSTVTTVAWASPVGFQMKLETTNTSGVSAYLSPFTITVQP